MKVLLLTPDITPAGLARTYNTGFSLMVNQIASALQARGDEVFVSSSSFFHPGLGTEVAGYRLLPRSVWSIIQHSRLKDWLKALQYIFTPQRLKIQERYNIAKYTISIGFNEYLIRSIHPDVISIHSIMPAVFPFISASLRCQIPFTISLHGVFSFSQPGFGTFVEQNILKLLIKRGIETTFVSSGTLQRLAICYNFHSKNMKVVLNTLPPSSVIPSQNEVRNNCIVSIGNLCERKNQWQTLMAYILLPETVRQKHSLCFIGGDGMNGKLQKEVKIRGLEKQVIFTGVLPRPDVYAWIKQSSLIVLASKDEGFGLSLIEGFRFGIPSLCFTDIDAYKDIASSNAVWGVKERSDEALAKGMEEALKHQWNSTAILHQATRFSDEQMANTYYKILSQAERRHITDNEFTSWVDEYVLHSYLFPVS